MASTISQYIFRGEGFALGVLILAIIGQVAGPVSAQDVYDARVTGSEILTPAPGPAPRINGTEAYGARPGKPLVYRIPTTGTRPISFSADGLPESVILDAKTGILTGSTPAEKGKYTVVFHAKNGDGEDSAKWTLVVGDTLALTPPMGWNHWYTHYHFITDKIIRAAADAMVAGGMADVGYSFVSIDDCWMRIDPNYVAKSVDAKRKTASKGLNVKMKSGPRRDAEGRILPARDFPDMKALTGHVHSYGLKAGIYTSPGPRTCQRFEGSYGHESLDAKTYAKWGFDLLKYDWCSYGVIYGKRMKQSGNDLLEKKRPFQQMGDILKGLDRDIVYNICQYGMSEVWKWGAAVGGQSWRTGGDLGHTLTKGGVYRIAKKNIGLRQFNGPGAWNDPDYLILGNWTSPFDKAAPPAPVKLTPNEQYSYMSLWCMMACPLFFSGDMASLDDFTRNVLCNTEMIAVNQGRLGRCAEPIVMNDDQWVLKKPMANGSVVVGVFNLDKQNDSKINVSLEQLGLTGKCRARDLWRQKGLGVINGAMTIEVGPRGCAVIMLSRNQ